MTTARLRPERPRNLEGTRIYKEPHDASRAHGQIGSLGSSLSPKRVMCVCPSMLKQSSYFEPAVSALQDQCQLSTSEEGMSKPPDVVPNIVLAAKQTQVLNMAQELDAWNLQALQASSLLSYALSAALRGRSTTGMGGFPSRAGLGSFLARRSFAATGAAAKARRSTWKQRISEWDSARGQGDCL